ncbi:CopG family transcriptional regulator [bacterium]|nr:CopG family transcriptional regulator [bacterium]
MTAAEFDRLFDEGHDISEYLDHESARRPGLEPKRVNVDFPTWMVFRLDREARRLGVTRQSIIKMWIGDRFKQEDSVRSNQDSTSPQE